VKPSPSSNANSSSCRCNSGQNDNVVLFKNPLQKELFFVLSREVTLEVRLYKLIDFFLHVCDAFHSHTMLSSAFHGHMLRISHAFLHVCMAFISSFNFLGLNFVFSNCIYVHEIF